jgi:ATP diphosphatase
MSFIEKLLDIIKQLRDEQHGCPWDREQSFATIVPYTIEEAYEVADAIARNDLDALRDELGDLLFQVVFHAQMAEEQGAFNFDDVARGICDKMFRRHPHVFGSAEERRAGPQSGSWERIKAEERSGKNSEKAAHSALDGVALALPALKRAAKLGKRAARTGFDWPDSQGPRDKIGEELDELAQAEFRESADEIQDELGDLLFSVVNLARHLDVDPEHALELANRKFERRFRLMEHLLLATGRTPDNLSLDELEAAWQQAKESLQKTR